MGAGYWAIEASEAARLREYLLKGGFVIFDDFEGPEHWDNMTRQMKRALPDHDFVRIDESHTIFKSFYNITKLDVPHPSMNVVPGYWAMFENNDPGGRMIALANHNNDIAEYLGVVGRGTLQPGPHRRRLPPRRQLLHLRDDALAHGADGLQAPGYRLRARLAHFSVLGCRQRQWLTTSDQRRCSVDVPVIQGAA